MGRVFREVSQKAKCFYAERPGFWSDLCVELVVVAITTKSSTRG